MRKTLGTLLLSGILSTAQAQMPKEKFENFPQIVVGYGSYSAMTHDKFDAIPEYRIEYRAGKSHLLPTNKKLPKLTSVYAFEYTSEKSLWVGTGFQYDFTLFKKFHIIPQLMAGFYDNGESDKNLGLGFEFREQIELGYSLGKRHYVGMALSHLSHLIGEPNPGCEAITIYYGLKLNRQPMHPPAKYENYRGKLKKRRPRQYKVPKKHKFRKS